MRKMLISILNGMIAPIGGCLQLAQYCFKNKNHQEKTIKTHLFKIIMVIICSILTSCFQNKENVKSELEASVEKVKRILPLVVKPGIVWTDSEYNNSVYTNWYEIDCSTIPFINYKQIKDVRKSIILGNISTGDEQTKKDYRVFIENNITQRIIYSEKGSNDKFVITISPKEIHDAINTSVNPLNQLHNWIYVANKLAFYKEQNHIKINMDLKDRTVIINAVLDEDKYMLINQDITSTKEVLMNRLLKNDMGKNIIKCMAGANCGLSYVVLSKNTKRALLSFSLTAEEILLKSQDV